MTITILRRYDINGAWTHDEEIRADDYTPPKNSMWKIHQKFTINEMIEYIESLEKKIESIKTPKET